MITPVCETFLYCPGCGSPPDAVGTSPFRCRQCAFSFYFGPAAAVGAVIVNRRGELLLLIRARDPGQGKYGLPGGFVDSGETLEDSLVREVREETGLRVTKLEYLCSFPNSYTYREVAVDVLDAFFVCEVESFEDLRAQPEEVDSFYIGVPTKEVLGRMAFESNRRAIELFLAQWC